jgi:hypothetical protein
MSSNSFRSGTIVIKIFLTTSLPYKNYSSTVRTIFALTRGRRTAAASKNPIDLPAFHRQSEGVKI